MKDTPTKNTLSGLASAIVVLGLAGALCAFPKPATVPSAADGEWQLKFEHQQPKRIVLNLPGSATPRAYWYMLYTVTNTGRQDRQFLPIIEMLTTDGRVIQSDRDTPPAVYDAIAARERNRYLEPVTKVTGRIRPGADEARTSVAIWAEPSDRMSKFIIFVSGLSSEAESYKIVNGQYVKIENMLTDLPDFKDVKELKQLKVMCKTLRLTYHVSGDEPGVEGQPQVLVPECIGEEWIMREPAAGSKAGAATQPAPAP